MPFLSIQLLNELLYPFLLTFSLSPFLLITFSVLKMKIFLLGLRFDSVKTFWKGLVIIIPFYLFKGITHAYLLQMSITHNKNLNPLLNLLINCIFASSAPQTFKEWLYFSFLEFLNWFLNWFVHSSANSLLEIFSFLTVLPEFFLSKPKPLKQVHVDIHHNLNF